jgi:hypothetical protein
MGGAPYRMIFSADGVHVVELSASGRSYRSG